MTNPDAPQGSPDNEPTFLCRIGTIFLLTSKKQKFGEYMEELCKALQGDPRVQWVKRPKLNPDFCSHMVVYPNADDSDSDEVMHGSDAMRAVHFDRPLLFKIVVPIKNQPQHHHADDIPTDTYWVSWDGVVVMVLWRHERKGIPSSGGQIILQLLEEICASANLGVFNQACSPACTNVFMHSDLIIKQLDDLEDCRILGSDRTTVYVAAPTSEEPEDALIELYYSFGRTSLYFARQKNMGRRIIDLEAEAWQRAAHLLSHYSAHAEASAKPFRKRIVMRWRNRGWRSKVRSLSAQTWVCMTGIEVMLRKWKEVKTDFSDGAKENSCMPIFETDYFDEVAIIESIDLSRLESMSTQVESRLDNRLISIATAGGAVSGAVAGALVTLLGG
ncbi:hypothetical protein [Streptomyces cinerochromogenes]|uniref:hypothetical protein n=1 Tax=Streptomyces cinerochromogenes TaxID=66422 RepID=UPI001670A73E|nr:hypothetical protein [Streptomyces cinerochromogenes]GGS50272.1 hypothetical protein GCM10010206_09790 [Streptomyces cinerochromogenes]